MNGAEQPPDHGTVNETAFMPASQTIISHSAWVDSSRHSTECDAGRCVETSGAGPVCVVLFAVMVSFWGLRNGPALGDHEAIVAVGARSIIDSGNWLVPTVGQEEFLRKPPLPFWLAAASAWLFDHPDSGPRVSEFAVRFPSALASVIIAAVVYGLGQAMFGNRIALISSAVMASCAGMMFFSHNAQVEVVLTLFSTCAAACFWFATECGGRSGLWWALFYASFALAMLAKAPLPLATVLLPLFLWWLVTVPVAGFAGAQGEFATSKKQAWHTVITNQWKRLLEFRIIPGMLLFLAVFLPWPLYVYLTRPGVLDLWQIEFLDRYSGDLGQTHHSYLYYIPIALGLVFPYSLSLPSAFAAGFMRGYAQYRKPLLFAFTWVAVQFVFLSTSAFKRPHYLVTALPGMALLLGPVLDRFFFGESRKSRKNIGWSAAGLGVILTIGLAIATIELSEELPKAMPSFRTAAVLLSAGCVASIIAFVLGRRSMSLMLVLATAAISFAGAWDALGRGSLLDTRITAMMQELKQRGFTSADAITWAGGRPDARLIYYMNLDVRPLFTALELAPRRDGRRLVSKDLYQKAAAEIVNRLKSDVKEYFVVKGEYWDALRSDANAAARLVFRAPCYPDDPDDDWVVITNGWNSERTGRDNQNHSNED